MDALKGAQHRARTAKSQQTSSMALALLIVTECILFLHPRPQVKHLVNHLT